MEPSYSFPQDDYALTILTQAAMHTQSSYDKPTSISSATAGGRESTTTITNHRDHNQNIHQRGSNVTQSRLPDILGDYNPAVLSSRSMEALTFNPAQSARQHAYMNPGFQGIGSQISTDYANNLGILNAESYDDGRAAIRAHEAGEMRMKNQVEAPMPFGITGGPRIRMDIDLRTDSEEPGNGNRRRKKPRIEVQSAEDEEEARKKARGRPRVDTKDETAADRRRTQIRMAQRAYRHRKETTISSLEKQVQDLRGTNEEMSNIFISLYDFAVGKGLLQREPEFGQQLQSTTERFLALAKASANEDSNHDENHVEENGNGKQNNVEVEADSGQSGRRTKGRKASPKKRQEATPPVSEPNNAWGGYSLSKEDSPIEDIPLDYQQGYGTRARQGDLQIITRPTEDNASFPFDLMDLQQYRVEVPSIDNFSHNFLPEAQLPLAATYSFSEFSFARRIHRSASQKAFALISATHPNEELVQRIFGICLLYETREEIKARLKRTVETSTKDSLHQWRHPLVHIGGAGTFYPMHDHDINGELMPKFRTGFSMGPFSPQIAQAQDIMADDMRLRLPGYEGDYFDAHDVEGYLRGRGLDIAPAADFVTGEVDLSALAEVPSPKSGSSITTALSPKTPRSPVDTFILENSKNMDSFGLNFTKFDVTTLPFPLGYTNWDKDTSATEVSNIDPIFNSLPEQNSRTGTPEFITSERQYGDKRTVVLNVETLIDELLSRAICLGRTPGFKPSDVNAAIIAAIEAGA